MNTLALPIHTLAVAVTVLLALFEVAFIAAPSWIAETLAVYAFSVIVATVGTRFY